MSDGEIRIVGEDLSGLEPGKSYPFGILVQVAGDQLEEDLEGVFERRIHEYMNYIQGVMHLNQRYDIWIRIGKKSFDRGLNSFKPIGEVLIRLFRSELPLIERISITFYTGGEEFDGMYAGAMERYESRDARARGLSDEEVDTFYGCALCQSFAPSHICVVTPQRYANCGAISWFDGRAAARMDPEGPIFPIGKGDLLDAAHGEYAGVNEHARKRSMGEVNRVYLYSAFGYPHTSCGCFEAIAFYIPEVDGFGIVHRRFPGPTVNGLPFSSLADSTAGGRQVEGFHGLSIEYMRSKKFLVADGGWERIVWIPSEIRDTLTGFIPDTLAPAIATEKDVMDVSSLRDFLIGKNHPVTERWNNEHKPGEPAEQSGKSGSPVFVARELPVMAGGMKIILKNARIYAERVIILPDEPKKSGGENS
jgi:acetyl-CoA decarbonylase/synthase complex subunit beta